MNVLIEIGHPAHVHFFKSALAVFQKSGDRVVVVTRNKEITNRLLDRLGIAYRSLSAPATGAGLAMELARRWWAIWRIMGRERIDVAVSISGISTALPAYVRGIPNLTITDTEDARLSNRIAFPFSDYILTPQFFLKDLGRKHIRYFGLHELAYLRDFLFAGLGERLAAMGLNHPFSIVRLIANDALHDRGLKACSGEQLGQLIAVLEPLGRVYITSQGAIPTGFEAYQLKIPIEHIHDVLAGAQCFVGESPTMAVEAGLLGTPSWLVSERWPKLGNMVHLQERKLLNNCYTWKEAISQIRRDSDNNSFRKAWKVQSEAFRTKTVDVSKYIRHAIQETAANRRPADALEDLGP